MVGAVPWASKERASNRTHNVWTSNNIWSSVFGVLPAVKMRGVAEGEYLHQDFFIIMDRLFGTLDQRINAWKKVLDKNNGICCGIGKNKEVFLQILKERMIVAYDLAVAFMYLHENRSVATINFHHQFAVLFLCPSPLLFRAYKNSCLYLQIGV